MRLDAGLHAFGRLLPEHPRADAWCVAGELERQALLARDAAANEITVVGDLVAEAIASVHRAQPGAPHGVALVRESLSVTDRAWLEQATPVGLPWLACPARDAGVAPWIAHVAAARVVCTDSVGWQRVAVALGVPCVVHPTADLWAPGVAASLVMQHGTRELLQQIVERAARLPRGKPAEATGVGARIVDVLLGPARAFKGHAA